MRLGVAIISLAAIALSGCASVPRTEAIALADSGKTATTAFRAQLTELSSMMTRAEEVNAFQQTYEPCALSGAACEIADPETDDVLAARDRLTSAVNARADAVAALGAAYESFRSEAQYEASMDLSSATKTLTASATNAVNTLAPPDARVALAVPATLAPHVAGWLADDMQKQRLRDGSRRIGDAAGLLARALDQERQVYVGFAEDFARREADVRAILASTNAVQRPRALEHLTSSLGLQLSANSETVVNNSVALRTASAAADGAVTRARIRLITRSYESAQRLMNGLSAAHTKFNQGQEPDIADLTRMATELTAIVTEIRALTPAPLPTTTPPPAPPQPSRR